MALLQYKELIQNVSNKLKFDTYATHQRCLKLDLWKDRNDSNESVTIATVKHVINSLYDCHENHEMFVRNVIHLTQIVASFECCDYLQIILQVTKQFFLIII